MPGYTPTPGAAAKLHVYVGDGGSPTTWTEIKLTAANKAEPYYVLNGTIRYESGLTVLPTLVFDVYSNNHSFVPDVGQPVLFTHDDFGAIFGGRIEQTKITNYPGHPERAIHTECQCVSWEKILIERNLLLAGAALPGAVTDTFHGDGETVSFQLSKLPTAIQSVTVNGVAKTFGQFGTAGVDWLWGVDIFVVNQADTTTPLAPGVTLIINYDAVDASAAAPAYFNMTAGAIVQALMALLSGEGFTVVIDDPGPVIDTITFNVQDNFASALDSICQYIANGSANYRYYITPYKVLHFEVQGITRTAPWTAESSIGTDGNVLVQVSNTVTGEKFANAAVVNIGTALSSDQLPARFLGDGSTKSFKATYPIGQTPTVTLYTAGFPFGPSAVQTVGVKGSTGFQWYWSPNSQDLEQDAGGTAMAVGHVLDVQYVGVIAQKQIYIDTTSVAARKVIEGGSGEHDTYLDLGTTLPFVLLKGTSVAQNLVAAVSTMAQSVEIVTFRGGLETGQAIVLSLPEIKAVGTYVIDRVVIGDEESLIKWQATCVAGAVIGDWKTALKNLNKPQIPIGGAQPLSVSISVSSGYLSLPFAASLIASGGQSPYLFEILSGSLPAGLVLDAASGAITGTPTAIGASPFTAKVTDGKGNSASADLSISILDSTPAGSPLTLAYPNTPGQVGVPYSMAPAASGGTLPYGYTITVGSLSGTGLSLNSTTGKITGTPTTAGFVSITVRITDAVAATVDFAISIAVAAQSGAGVPLPAAALTSVTGRDVGHGTDVPDAVTRLVAFTVGATANWSSTPNQYATVFLSRDGGSNWLGINWYLWTASGQEIPFVQIRPAATTNWKIAICPRATAFDPNTAIPTASLPTGTVVAVSTFSVAGLALPAANLITTLTIPYGLNNQTNFPYDQVGGKNGHYWSIPSFALSDLACISDPNARYIRLTARDKDAAGNYIGPEQPFSGAQVGSSSNNAYSFGPLQGEYGDDGGSYKRSGELASVEITVYVSNRYREDSYAFADTTNCSTIQTSLGTAGRVTVDVAKAVQDTAHGGHRAPIGTFDHVDRTNTGGGVQFDPATGRLITNNDNPTGTFLDNGSFELASAGVLGAGGMLQGWNYGLNPGGSIEVKSDGGNSGAYYARLSGADTQISQTKGVQGGQPVYFQMAVRSSNTAGAAHAVGIYIVWLDANDAPLTPYTAIVGTVSGYVSAWESLGISGYVTAPSGAAKAILKVSTGAGETGYWDVDDVFMQPVISQTANSQTNTTNPLANGGDYSALRTASLADSSSSYYGRQRMDLNASDLYGIHAVVATSEAVLALQGATTGNQFLWSIIAGVLTAQQNIGGTPFTGYSGTVQAAYAANKAIKNGMVCN